MDIRVEHVDGFKVAGISGKVLHGEAFSQLWDEFFDKVPEDEFKSLGFNKGYGILLKMDDETTEYMVAYDYSDELKVKELGLEIREIAAGEYAKLRIRGAIPDSIKSGWEYLWGTFFKEGEYRPTESPSLEVYFEGDLYSKKYEMEIWVPVMKI